MVVRQRQHSSFLSDCHVIANVWRVSGSFGPQLAISSSDRPSRKTTANTWAHARDPAGSEPSRCGRKNEKIYYCRHCMDPPYFTSVSTTLRNHLLKIHSIELEAPEHPVKRQRSPYSGRLCQNWRDTRGEAAVRTRGRVKKRRQPQGGASWPELHALISAINPAADGVIILSNGSLQQLVADSYSIHKDILRRKASLGICVRFVDGGTKKALQALLALPELPGLDGPSSHGSAEQWKIPRRVIADYNIWYKIGFYTGDNHGSNDKLCRFLGEHLQGKRIAWDTRTQRIRCHGHILNLAVQVFLFMDSKEASLH
ncbi:uncharacterized protein BBA_09038 [Beauveria bassiana ARSEF 2860]|uniref:Uncharacterized protein n=1 Tax=Beauveria bassiana (strain ARSEF 2860) TaxID=655819 RepID=J4VTX5_BEAB2|nr:uncharacterized protein BBA_09038 [Beauveria bassiana ARSEF 2860]EJP61990.1 hypothetical protein BBA_09038 [Beauveria bassiana ARSEF 2860]